MGRPAVVLLALVAFAAFDGVAPAAAGAAPKRALSGRPHHRATTVIVNMVLNAQGMRFEPSNIVISSGDVIRFVNVSGGPHNVAFDPRAIPAAAKGPITAAMSGTLATLSGPRISAPNAVYTMTFANVPPGSYPFFCVLHLGMGMTGTITVRE
jgi:plastocyanin